MRAAGKNRPASAQHSQHKREPPVAAGGEKKTQRKGYTMFGKHTPTKFTGRQWKFKFPNGYGASVINDGYGRDRGQFELAVLGLDGHLTYDTPVTNDVLGYLSEAEVATALDQIEALPAEVTS